MSGEDWRERLQSAAAERMTGFQHRDVAAQESSARTLDELRRRELPDDVLVLVMQERLRTEVGLIESGRTGVGAGPAPIRALIADGLRVLDRAEDPEQRAVLAGLLACAEVMAVKADLGPFDGERVRALLPLAESARDGGPDWAESLAQVRTLLRQYDALTARSGTPPPPAPAPSGAAAGDLLIGVMAKLRDGDLAGARALAGEVEGLVDGSEAEPYLRTVRGVLSSLAGHGEMPGIPDIGAGAAGGGQMDVMQVAGAMTVAAASAVQAGQKGDLAGVRSARDALELLVDRVAEGYGPLRARIAALAANVDAALARGLIGDLEAAAHAVRLHERAMRLNGGPRTVEGTDLRIALGEMLRLSGTADLARVRRLGLDALRHPATGAVVEEQAEWVAQVIGWCAADLGSDPGAAEDLVVALDAARNRELGRTAAPVGLGAVRAALGEVDADVLVQVLPGRAVVITVDGSVEVVTSPLLGARIEDLRDWAGQAVLEELLGRCAGVPGRVVVVPFGALGTVRWDESLPVRVARSAGLLTEIGR
ncbi:hypothetical protein GCM10010168_46550 [Actinoplanes ianthinogenes]|uniref:Uncharacterized protein n=1 Tax=Actinoplanes ianthinogenes TaxID=122358 RepID=A0ABM7LP35_9ACTN|nr:hypothetical protein [Actinoplanes ianthinogenes]BCJ41047.1 hypothetical protein Aiant_17040 [Actinoplanes ianthinogenes]GGR23267.1 hypothetical protein GCM10010168_46550 [Actinoplanes ianthinogenes]